MPNLTVCGRCGVLYEAGSEEQSAERSMVIGKSVTYCPACVTTGVEDAVLDALAFDSPLDREVVRRRLAYDDDGE